MMREYAQSVYAGTMHNRFMHARLGKVHERCIQTVRHQADVTAQSALTNAGIRVSTYCDGQSSNEAMNHNGKLN